MGGSIRRRKTLVNTITYVDHRGPKIGSDAPMMISREKQCVPHQWPFVFRHLLTRT